MHLLSVVLISVIVRLAHASWISDLTSPNGLNFGDGVSLKLEDTKMKNSSFLDRVALRIDNANLGVSMAQNPEKAAIELDFYMKDKIEGRGKKMGNMLLPFMMGATGAGAMSVAIGGIKMIVLKAMMIAKVALILSVILLVGKLMKEKEHGPQHIELEHHAASEVYPGYPEYQHSGGGYNAPSGGGGGFGGYSYGPSAAESVLNYATVEAPGGNGSLATMPVVQQMIPADHYYQNQ